MRRCEDCGCPIDHLHHHAKRCKECQSYYRTAKSRICHKLRKKVVPQLGTTDFGAHRKETDEQELSDIRKEMKRLGLR